MPESHGDASPNASASLTKKDDALYFEGQHLHYRMTGLTPYNFDRMKVTIKAYKPDNLSLFHLDTLDLYQARIRDIFTQECQKIFGVDGQGADLTSLITLLEQERVRIQESKGKKEPPKLSDAEKKETLDALKNKDLLRMIVDDFQSLGLVGESHNKLLGYLAAVSRLLPDPLGVLILSRSGAGKTSLQDAVCKFIPPESVIQYTRLTGQSLFYREEDALKNKVLAIEEEEGMQQAMYSIRILQSSQRLSIATTCTHPKTGKMFVEEHTVYGPTSVFISTTNPEALDPETRQRFLILTIDESIEQTKKILEMQRLKNSYTWYKTNVDESSITKLHHNMQRLLKPLTPILPDSLKIEYPFSRLQMRREQRKYLSLIKSIALLHQYQRKQGTMKRLDGNLVDYVMVTKQDVDLALEIGRPAFARNVDDVTPTGRTLLQEIRQLIMGKYAEIKAEHKDIDIELPDLFFTRKELRDRIGWSEAQVRQNLFPLVELGYIGILSGKNGSAFRYIMIDDGKNDPKFTL